MATITKIKINGVTYDIESAGTPELTKKVNNAQTTADDALALANEVKDYLDSLPAAEGGAF